MKTIKIVMILTLCPMFALSAAAQTVGTQIDRNVNQQERIQNGLESGALTVHEAAKLEKAESQVNHMQARALKDGTLTAQEANRIDTAQNKTSAAIHSQKHDAQKGNPDSISSMRMQEDVQRNLNQQQRIQQGVSSGELTNHEVAKLERGQAHQSRLQSRAGMDGHVSTQEQQKIQRKHDKRSRKIHHQKHDRQGRS